MKDGVYEVETKEADDHGGKAKVSVTVKDGKITEASFIEFNDNGNKRENPDYNKNMKEASGTRPQEYEPELEKQVVDKQSAEIDGVSGATASSDKAKSLFASAIENANEGNTEKNW
ncbi:MAG: FMN-binding protein [Paraclostridium sp.]